MELSSISNDSQTLEHQNSKPSSFQIPPTFQNDLDYIVNETIQSCTNLLNSSTYDTSNFISYAPKKASADLHTRIKPELDLLDELTEKKINQIVQERITLTNTDK